MKYDVYLSYSMADMHAAKDVASKLKEEKSDIRIFSDKQILKDDAVWQEDIYQVMVSCVRYLKFCSIFMAEISLAFFVSSSF